jgi:hypothetical protein
LITLEQPLVKSFGCFAISPFLQKDVYNITISMTEIETMVKPDSMLDDFWWETMTFINIHALIML